MGSNSVTSVFKLFLREKLGYSVLERDLELLFDSRFELPDGRNSLNYFKSVPYPTGTLEKVDVELFEGDFSRAHSLLKSLGFVRCGSFGVVHSFFRFDKSLGLVNLRVVLVKKVSSLKSVSGFPVSSKKVLVRGSVGSSSFRFNGRFVCFVGPEGGGKTSLTSALNTILERFPAGRSYVTFSSFRESRVHRVFDLTKKFFSVFSNWVGGSVLLSDRYVYLTFQNRPFVRRLFLACVPRPSMVFILKSDYAALKKRRGPLCKSKSEVSKMYGLFSDAPRKIVLDTNLPLIENVEIAVNTVLGLYSKD